MMGTMSETLAEDKTQLERRMNVAAFKFLNEEIDVHLSSLNTFEDLLRSLCSTEIDDMIVKPVEFLMSDAYHNTLLRYENLSGVLDGLNHDSYDFRQ